MSRDPMPRQRTSKSGSRGNTLIGIFVGLILGALVAAGIAYYFTASSPFQKASSAKPEEHPVVVAPKPATSEPIALPGKPGDKPVEKPRFDFYNVLPKGSDALPAPVKPEETAEVVKPKPEPPPAKSDDAARAERILKGEPADKPNAPATPAVIDKYYLQAGAFGDPAEADNLKARLALMGVEASVQKVDVPDKGVVHRVRVGPYMGQDEMGKARAQLASSGIDVTIVRIRPKEPKPVSSPQ